MTMTQKILAAHAGLDKVEAEGLYNFVIKLTVRKENIENGRKR